MPSPTEHSLTAEQKARQEAKQKSCQHWLAQLIKTFPKPEKPLTPERVTAMIAAMESFSEASLAKVCGPSGIIQSQPYLPNPSELKQALEATEKPVREFERDLAVRLRTLEDRTEQARIDAERPSRPTYEQLISKLPDSLRLQKGRPGEFSSAEKSAFLTKYNVTEEEFNALPNGRSNELTAKPVGESIPPAPARSPQAPSHNEPKQTPSQA